MFFETRRSLIGFRLKLVFDPVSLLEPTYVYVDVTKTPTVADLIKDIRDRFKITDEIFIAFDNCPLLLSENVCVLADVNQVSVGMVVAVTSSLTKSSHTNIQPLTEPNLHAIHKTPPVKPVKTKKYSRVFDGVAAAIKQLQDRKTSDEPADERGISAVINEFHDKTKRRKNSVDGDNTLENGTNKMVDNRSSDIDEAAFDDVNDLILEKPKRKRKRKHAKKTKTEVSVADEPKRENVHCNVPINVERKHIFFNHEDEQDTVVEQNTDTTDAGIKSSFETYSFRNLPATDENGYEEPHVNEKAEQFPEPLSVNNNKFETSYRAKTAVSDVGSPSTNFQELYRSRTNSTSSQISLPNLRFQRGDLEKTKKAEQFPEPISVNNNKFETLYRAKPAASDVGSPSTNYQEFYRSRTNSTSSQISLPNLRFQRGDFEKTKSADKIEKELSTLLMCKQLDSCCQYTVQFSGGKGPKVNPRSDLSLNGIYDGKNTASNVSLKSFCDERESLGKSSMFVKSTALNNCTNDPLNRAGSEVCAPPDCNSEGDVHRANDMSHVYKTKSESDKNTLIENVDDSSNECEVLKQFKIDDDKVRLRNPNGNWQVLTSEIADKELPVLDVPKDSQSIVFQMLYLNKYMCPTVSDLIYGQVLRYHESTDKLALEIPFGFIKELLQEDDQELRFPEELIPITADIYEIHRSTLRNAKLLT